MNRIVHLDIKADNILMDGRQKCKITDFGTAVMLMEDKKKIGQHVGTPWFMAPEVV